MTRKFYEFDDNKIIEPVKYENTNYYNIYKTFMNSPEKFIKNKAGKNEYQSK